MVVFLADRQYFYGGCVCSIQEIIQKELPNFTLDPEVYSIEELVSIRTGEMKSKLKYLVELCCRHTSECEVI